jgi:hypothetical protein
MGLLFGDSLVNVLGCSAVKKGENADVGVHEPVPKTSHIRQQRIPFFTIPSLVQSPPEPREQLDVCEGRGVAGGGGKRA